MNDLSKIIGTGVVFPLQLSSTGTVEITSDIELIRSSIRAVVTWPKFTHHTIYTFGNQSNILLEEPNDFVTGEMIRAYTIDALSLWEKRISLNAVSAIYEGSTINIGLKYTILNTNIQDSFIFPFYEKINY